MFTDHKNTPFTTSNFAFFRWLSMTSDNEVPAANGSNVTGAYPL
jgi:hypothetical protein